MRLFKIRKAVDSVIQTQQSSASSNVAAINTTDLQQHSENVSNNSSSNCIDSSNNNKINNNNSNYPHLYNNNNYHQITCNETNTNDGTTTQTATTTTTNVNNICVNGSKSNNENAAAHILNVTSENHAICKSIQTNSNSNNKVMTTLKKNEQFIAVNKINDLIDSNKNCSIRTDSIKDTMMKTVDINSDISGMSQLPAAALQQHNGKWYFLE